MTISKQIIQKKTAHGYCLSISIKEQDKWLLQDLQCVLDLFFKKEDELQRLEQHLGKTAFIPRPDKSQYHSDETKNNGDTL